MGGKLIGIGAVGLTLIAAWVAFAAVGLAFLPPDWSATVRPALASLGSIWAVAALVFYFLTGYLAVTMLFLAVGAMSDSMQDAQGYLMPIMMLINLPIFVLMSTTFQNPDGILPRVLSWIPPYAPFAMLMRLGAGLPLGEILGTAALMIVFLALEFVALGRVFRASLLRTGQPPKLGALVGMMFAGGER
jgi:ABC-2 type transport system permease protein